MQPGTKSSTSARYSLNPGDDYPDFVLPLAGAVAAGKLERGVAICGSGVGAAVCAGKVPGVRAALIHDHFSACQGVEDDHMNIICMGGRTVGPAVAWDLVQTFSGCRIQSGPATPAAAGQGGRIRGHGASPLAASTPQV